MAINSLLQLIAFIKENLIISLINIKKMWLQSKKNINNSFSTVFLKENFKIYILFKTFCIFIRFYCVFNFYYLKKLFNYNIAILKLTIKYLYN